MTEKPSPIDELNEYYRDSGFSLVPWLDDNQEQIGWGVKGMGLFFGIPHLDTEAAAVMAKTYLEGVARGLYLAEQRQGSKDTSVSEALDNMKARAITGVNKLSLDDLNEKLAVSQYRVIPGPDPLDENLRGYLLMDLKSNCVVRPFDTDDERLVCLLVNNLFHGFKLGVQSSREEALRIAQTPVGNA